MYAQRCVVVGILLTTLGGCVTIADGPERVYPVAEQITDMRAYEQQNGVPVLALTESCRSE